MAIKNVVLSNSKLRKGVTSVHGNVAYLSTRHNYKYKVHLSKMFPHYTKVDSANQ